MTRVVALVRMRIAAYVGLQRVWPPLVAALALVSVAHAGGVAPPNQAYAFSAALLFGVFGWQTKLVLDTEPDEQRLLAKIGVGSRGRELAAGLLAALVMVLPVVVLGVVAPLLVGAVEISGGWPEWAAWVAFGGWLHVLSAMCGLAVGALASRPVIAGAGWSVMIVLAVPVLVLVLGSRQSQTPRWLVPQLFAASRIEGAADLGSAGVITVHALGWAALLLAGYAALRRSRF
ncbi:hypothetical protein ABN034_01615 [Actinopolymorpha sp. B11F2]|uniref:hypothetical protein n=1 Tax=Actinopolymorpha sp. B11F2 TaxID=3160862 RepID=UPI0032E45169